MSDFVIAVLVGVAFAIAITLIKIVIRRVSNGD